MPCGDISENLAPDDDGRGAHAEWCLLLVGWDNEQLPVASVPLPDGPTRPPRGDRPVVPLFNAPLRLLRGLPGARRAAKAGGSEEVAALHLEPRRGRLWALLADGSLQAWELPAARSLGRWWPRWPSASAGGPFLPGALCEEPSGGALLVAGSRGDGGAELLQAPAPPWRGAP
mmetsp:Transcript_54852/g.169862  ORF Transcript_54852/g.169862 Transcript_54852/m.169862 type:complete len:173 (-) Transcript_54852:31-549(-)